MLLMMRKELSGKRKLNKIKKDISGRKKSMTAEMQVAKLQNSLQVKRVQLQREQERKHQIRNKRKKQRILEMSEPREAGDACCIFDLIIITTV